MTTYRPGFVRRLKLPPLSASEKTLFCEYLSQDKIDASLRGRMQREVERQSDGYIKLRLPAGKTARQQRRIWRMFIRGPFGGWKREGKRIRRKWDPADRRARLSFAVLAEFKKPLKATILYEDDLFQWWIVRALATREMRTIFECWYCGKISWGQRSTARFCNDRCRMRYHLARRNQEKLKGLPRGQRKRAYREMRRRGAEIGLIDMPIARRSLLTTKRQKRKQRT